MEEQTEADIKAKIAKLRMRYARLREICGRQAISKETIEEYAKALQNLQVQIS
jgi:N-methylhydantoinase B/oxoprolinase/acetone carboxylase alpha subunit